MPRQVDHHERRSLIVRTFQAQVAEGGLGSATFPRVARQAGISVGLIQHYFENKEALLRFVYEDALRARDDRIAVVIAEGDAAERPIRTIVRNALLELLPLDDVRTREQHVAQALLTQALHDPSLRDVAVRADAGLHRRAAIAVANGRLCGEVEAGTDPDVAAADLLTTVHGLGTRLLLAAATAATTAAPGAPTTTGAVHDVVHDVVHEAVLDAMLEAWFPGRCRHYQEPARLTSEG